MSKTITFATICTLFLATHLQMAACTVFGKLRIWSSPIGPVSVTGTTELPWGDCSAYKPIVDIFISRNGTVVKSDLGTPSNGWFSERSISTPLTPESWFVGQTNHAVQFSQVVQGTSQRRDPWKLSTLGFLNAGGGLAPISPNEYDPEYRVTVVFVYLASLYDGFPSHRPRIDSATPSTLEAGSSGTLSINGEFLNSLPPNGNEEPIISLNGPGGYFSLPVSWWERPIQGYIGNRWFIQANYSIPSNIVPGAYALGVTNWFGTSTGFYQINISQPAVLSQVAQDFNKTPSTSDPLNISTGDPANANSKVITATIAYPPGVVPSPRLFSFDVIQTSNPNSNCLANLSVPSATSASFVNSPPGRIGAHKRTTTISRLGLRSL
jgi:hypothetical protein